MNKKTEALDKLDSLETNLKAFSTFLEGLGEIAEGGSLVSHQALDYLSSELYTATKEVHEITKLLEN